MFFFFLIFRLKAWQQSRKLGMELKLYEKRIVKAGLENTKWENLTFFLDDSLDRFNYSLHTAIMFCPNLMGDALLKYEKKVPELFFMGMYYNSQLL